ncbi:TonB-dependent siderophore receptor [Pyxidicoccus fallax]|uniref:TonB-dependent siderophore receptor n=1 Tax=Pyxidicoccus fallax TaxID=394095 RepID=A0A848LXY1_9BACT|nr:TonB-dependent siderophore receptor [Pyxidicoccus fallax]NMO22676.1 TonB-dependent siderophore receptor [Pyxidicoccus fallax]NPC84750.1 TonB-dependent siderophore receptor [Pyxidicoccus fallax]
MSPSHPRFTGIRSSVGHSGGVRAALQAAVGLASALATSAAVAQEPVPTQAAPATPPAVQVTESTSEAAPAAPAPGTPADTQAAGQGAEDTFVLPTVQVQGEAERGYEAPESSLTRLPKPLVDTPQTVTVVNETVIEEQRVTTVREALRNVSGITISAGEAGRQGDSFILRGFSAQNDISRDGARDMGWYARDTFNLEGVEAYFGPSAVLFGRGSTGGAINLVTKKPKKTSFQDLAVSGGTAPSGRVEVDLNEALSEDFQVRLNAMGELGRAASRDVVQDNRGGIAPSLRYQLSENTAFEADYLFQREVGVPDYGQPYFNGAPVSDTLDVPRESFYGVNGSDHTRVNAHVASGRLLQKLAEGFQFTNTLRYGRVDRFTRPTSPRGLTPAPAPTNIGRQRFEIETDNSYLANLADVRGTFDTGFLKHTANAGVELTWEKRGQERFNLNAVGLPSGPNLPADLFNPDNEPDLSPVQRTYANANVGVQRTLGLYVADQIALGKYVEVLGSLRYDVFNTDYTAVATNGTKTRLEQSDKMVNWRAGVVVHPMEGTSVYGMYGTSSNPSAEAGTVSADTVSLDPEKNAILEFGAKGEFLDGRLGLTGAVFRMEKTDARVPNTDPEGPPQILAGEQRVQGFNVGVAGTVMKDLRMLANYTLMDSAITEHTNPYLVGQRLPNTPRHSLSLWTTYQVLERLSVGGGAVYQDVTSVNNPTSASQATNRVPNFWRFDAFASYEWGKAQLQLNVYNLTNALYYDQYYAGHAVPAEGISALLTARYRF